MKRSRARSTANIAFVVALLSGVSVLLLAGCDSWDEAEEEVTPTTQQQAASAALGGVGNGQLFETDPANVEDLVMLTEPDENAFTIQMPKGWQNQAHLVRTSDVSRTVATAVSPGGDTLLFFGDPKMPNFAEPTPEFNQNSPWANRNPMMKVTPFQSAETFFTTYIKKKFGKMPGFRITGTAPNPRLDQFVRNKMLTEGLQKLRPKFTTTLIAFDYQDKGKPIHALVNGLTLSVGPAWVAEISGVSTTGDPKPYTNLLFRIAQSFRTNPEWQAQQQAASQREHERRMAMIQANTDAMTLQHQRNMAAIQASAQQHQRRMDAIHAAGDAQLNRWYAQQAQSDGSHQRFMNYVRDENTVVSPSSGQSYQVQTGSDRYYKNRYDNTYIGTDSTKDPEDLRKAWGLNPDDYEEMKIKP